ncbi:MAG: hypothetical protein GY775_02235 [Candidatus Scalindua sp.]|nr:hypothetical protein [Candidatus Scalindua sp.]
MNNHVYGKSKLMMLYCITLFVCVTLASIIYANETIDDAVDVQVEDIILLSERVETNIADEDRAKKTEVEFEDEKSLEEDEIKTDVTDVVHKKPKKIFKDKLYPTAFECKVCHPVQFRQWSVSMHAYANVSPAFISQDNKTQRISNGTAGDICTRCHNPVGARMGVKSTTSNMDREQKTREGITCIVCHRRDKRYGKVSGRITILEGDIYGPIIGPSDNTVQEKALKVPSLSLVTSSDEEGRSIHSEVIQDKTFRAPIFCAPCHTARAPTGLHTEETFDEYKLSKSAKEGETCQDCHMGKVQGENKGFDEGPAAIIGNFESEPRRITNHLFAGPDFTVLHPGIFPHNPDAVSLANYRQWLQFDHEAGWGTDEFEDDVSDDYVFPEYWDDIDLRYEARDVLNDQFELLEWANEQRKVVLKAAYKVDRINIKEASIKKGLRVDINLHNPVEGHNVPTGFIHERMVFIQITVTDSQGNVVFRSGDRDPNGDLRETFSRYVRNGELPYDDQLFNLQSHFISRHRFGGERAQINPAPFSFAARPFIRPPANPTSIAQHPINTRVFKASIGPGGYRMAHYKVDKDKLKAGETYTIDMKVIAQPMAGFFINDISPLGFDYNFSLRELVDRTVANSVVVWEGVKTVTIN